jgi:hypothetical protein
MPDPEPYIFQAEVPKRSPAEDRREAFDRILGNHRSKIWNVPGWW